MSIDDATTAANDRLADRDDMIVCVNVDKFYGDFQALKGVTATIKEGEVAAVSHTHLTLPTTPYV